MNAGDVVKFREVVEAGDETLRFVVVEMRGDRVLVRDDETHMSIKPTFCYRAADLQVVA